MIRVCVAGITGWTGGPIARAIAEADDLELASGVSRSAAGTTFEDLGAPIFGSVAEALEDAEADVVVDFTDAAAVKENVLAAIAAGDRGRRRLERAHGGGLRGDRRGAPATPASASSPPATSRSWRRSSPAARPRSPATSRLGDHRLRERRRSRTSRAAPRASWPSGSARPAAPRSAAPLDRPAGPVEARGATVAGTQIHSVRLPSFVVSTEIVFAAEGERLTLRHDPARARRTCAGTLSRSARYPGRVGLTRGDSASEA